MKFLTILIICLVLICLSFSQQEFDQPFLRKYLESRPELQRRVLLNDDCIKWHQKKDYRGDSTTKCNSIKEVGSNWKNRYSSVEFGNDIDWVKVYSSKKWEGTSAYITSSMTDLSDINGKDLDDDIQSFSISKKLDDDCIRFWEDENLNGGSWKVCSTDNSIPTSRQGRYNYVQFGANVRYVQLWGNTYFNNHVSGQSSPGNTQQLKSINKDFKSFQIKHTNLPANCLNLYQQTGYNGPYIEICHSYSQLGYFSDTISSIQFGENIAKVRLYEDTSYNGDYVEFTGSKFNGLGNNWNNRGQSIVVYKD